MNRGFHALLWVLCTAAACRRSPAAVADVPGVPQVPDSVWVEVAGPTLVAFHERGRSRPSVQQARKEEGLPP